MNSHADSTPARTQRSRDPWRWRCPHGHTSWIKSGDQYYCRTCTRNKGEGEGVHFDSLLDAKEADL